jgi:hypothetical protein
MVNRIKKKRLMSDKIISTKYSDQTLGTYVDFMAAGEDTVSQIQAITGLKRDDIRKIDVTQIEKIVTAYANGLKNDEKIFKQFIDIDGVKFGFHPNLKSMTFGEWLDLSELSKNFPHQLPELMCILYRPVTAEINQQYKIEDYDSDVHLKYAPQMRKLNLANVNAALLFFSTLRNDLVNNTPAYLEQELERLKREISQLADEVKH